MGTPHKHAELIKAWADGEEVEWNDAGVDGEKDAPFGVGDVWCPVISITTFAEPELTFRMKPKTVTTKGYKRYAWQQNNLEWVVGIIHEGNKEDYSNRIYIDKEWQYHVIEEV